MAGATARTPVGKGGQGWASLSSLPPSLAVAGSYHSDLLTRGQWIVPSLPLSILTSLLPCQGSASGAALSCSGFCLLLQPHFLSFSLLATSLGGTGFQPDLLHLRTFALAVSLPGMLCSHGQVFLVIHV